MRAWFNSEYLGKMAKQIGTELPKSPEANKKISSAFMESWRKSDVLGSPVRIAESWAGGSGFMEGLEKELLVDSKAGWLAKDNLRTGRAAATAGAAWVAGNAGVGMIKGVFTDRNGNFDMPLVPGL